MVLILKADSLREASAIAGFYRNAGYRSAIEYYCANYRVLIYGVDSEKLAA